MARQIDEKIVQMTFNNQSFEKNATKTIGTLEKLKGALDMSGAVDGFKNIEAASNRLDLSSLTIATTKISEGFSILEQIATGALRRIGEWAVNTGSQLLKSMTIDPFKISWAKYDESIASEQAIMSAVEGKFDAEGRAYDMEAVVERVERLKWFADETSYSITQMTNALGQFTASGQDLDKSVTAVMGIANACADAGVSTQKAESAFIGFSKAIGSGTLTLGTWNMQLKTSGLTNSERFRKTLLESAVAMGTLTKEADKFYFKGTEITTANFTEYLSKGIITADALIETLNRYADTTLTVREIQTGNVEAIVDLYKTANKEMSSEMSEWVKSVEEDGATASQVIENLTKAYEELGLEVPQSLKALRRAQEAISFTQAIEATAEAVTSQFSNIYHLMVGNYEEAKALWSSMADSLNEWFVGPLYDLVDIFAIVKKSWNDMEWDESNGEKPVTQLLAIWEELATAIDNIKDAFHDLWVEVFDVPEMEDAAQSIFNFLENIRSSLKSFNEFMADPWRNRDNGWDTLFQTLMMIFQAMKLIKDILGTIVKSFITPLSNKLKPILNDIFAIIQNIANVFESKFYNIGENLSPLEKILQGILDILDPVINLFAKFVKWVRDLTSAWREAEFDDTTEKFSFLGYVVEGVANIFEGLGKAFKGTVNIFKSLGSGLSEVFNNIKGSVSEFLNSNGTDISRIAEGGFLAYIVLGLTSVTKKLKGINLGDILEKIKDSLSGKGGLSFISTVKETFSTLTDSIKTFTESIKVKMLDMISNSLLKLAASLLVISLIDSSKLVGSLGGIATLLGETLIAMSLMSKINGKGLAKASTAFDKIAAGLLVLSLSLKIISTIDSGQMISSIVGMGAVLLEMLIFIGALNQLTDKLNEKKIVNLGKFMKALGVSMIEMSIALKIMSTMNAAESLIAVADLAATLTALGIFLAVLIKITDKADEKKITNIGKFMKALGVSMIELSLALKVMSTIGISKMGSALLGLTGTLTALGAFIIVMSKVNSGGSFAIMSAGLLLMSAGLAALSVSLIALGKIGWETVGNGILMMVAAIASIGLVSSVLGVASPLFALFSVALLAFGAGLNMVVKALTAALPLFAAFQVMGTDFASTLTAMFTNLFSTVLTLLPSFILGIIDAILNVLDQVKDLIVKLVTLVVETVVELLPTIIDAGIKIIMALLTGIRDNIYQIVDVVVDIITTFLSALGEKLPELIDGVLSFFVNMVNGVAESIRNNAGDIGSAFGNLAAAILEGIVSGLWGMVSSFGTHIWEAIKSLFSGSEATAQNTQAGENVVGGVQTGMQQKEPELLDHVDRFSDEIVETMDKKDDAVESGKSNITGLFEGVTDGEIMGETISTLTENMKLVTDEMNKEEDATESGKNTLNGLLSGVTDSGLLSSLFEAGINAGNTFMSGYDSVAKIASPSKEMKKRGRYMIEGLIQGLKDVTDLERISKSTGELVMNAISKAMEIAENMLDETNPVITPVLDLSEIQNGGNLINSLLGSGTYALNNGLLNTPLNINANQEEKPEVNNTINIDFNVSTETELDEQTIYKYGGIIANVVNVELGKRYS